MINKTKQLMISLGVVSLIIILFVLAAAYIPFITLKSPSNQTFYNTSSFTLICNYTAYSETAGTYTGVTNISTYHDFTGSFTQNKTFNTYDNWYFNVTDPTVEGMFYNGTNFWLLSRTNKQIKRYNGSGIYDNWYLNASAQATNPSGFTYNGSNFWIVDDTTGKVFRYNITGGYDNWYFNTSTQLGSPLDVFYNGTNFWVSTNNGGGITPYLYRYQKDGTYDNYFLILGGSQIFNPSAIYYNGSRWWVGDYVYATVGRFKPEGEYDNWSMWLAPWDNYIGNLEGDVEGVSVYNEYLYIYGSVNDRVYRFTHTPSYEGTVSYAYTGINDGMYHWNCKVTLSNNTALMGSSNLTFIIDTTNPQINYMSPTYNNLTSINTQLIINYSVTDTNVNMSSLSNRKGSQDWFCTWAIITGYPQQTNAIETTCGANYKTYASNYMYVIYTGANFSEGEGRYQVYGDTYDNAGNRNLTEYRTFYYDTTAPKISLQSPQSIVYIYNTSIPLNYVANDTRWEYFFNATSGFDYAQANTTSAYISSTWYNIDGELNTTLTGNTFINASNGAHILYIFTNDTAGNVQTSQVAFTVSLDSTNPVVILDYPTNGTWYKTSSINFNYTATDSNLSSCFLYGDFDGTWKINQTSTILLNGTSNTWAAVSLNTGTYHWNTVCNDTTSNIASALSNYTFYVDTVYPLFYNESHNPLTMYKNYSLIFNITTIETNIQTVWLETNTSGNWKNYTMVGTYPYYTFNLSSGNFSNRMNITYRFHANDSAGNENQSIYYYLSVTNRVPNELTILTTNGTYYGTTDIVLNVTSTDPDSDTITYHFVQSNGSYIGASTTGNYTWSGFTITSTYQWFSFATDGYLNTSNTLNQTIYTELTYPNITLTAPINTSTTTSLTPLLTYAVADNGIYTSCWYSVSYYPSNVLIVDNTTLSICNSTLTSYSLSLPTYTQYVLNFYVNDSANNINSTRLFFTIQQGSNDNGGGSGGPSAQPPINTNQTIPAQAVFCGDKVCSPSEDLVNCPVDCPLNFDTLGTTLQQAWFARFAFFFIIGAIFYMAYYDGLGKAGGNILKKMKRRFKPRR